MKSLCLLLLLLPGPARATTALPAAPAGPASFGSPAWAPSYPAMAENVLSGLQRLLGDGPSLTGQEYSPLFSIHALDAGSEAQRAALGAFNARLELGFSGRLEETLTEGEAGAPARRALLEEARQAYADSATEVHRILRTRAERITTAVARGEMGADEIEEAARELRPWAFYGPEAQKAIKQVRSLARAARADVTMGAARALASTLLDRFAQPSSFDGVPADGRTPTPGGLGLRMESPIREIGGAASPPSRLGTLDMGLGSGELAERTALEAQFDRVLRRLGLTMSDARNGDGGAVREFVNRIRREELGLTPATYKFFENLENNFNGRTGRLVLLRDESGRIVATAAFAPFKRDGEIHEGASELELIFVDRDWRGDLNARAGIKGGKFSLGKNLVLLMMLESSRSGYDTMELNTRYGSMHTAFRLYNGRLGFLPSSNVLPDELKEVVASPGELAYLARDILPATLAAEFPAEFGPAPL